jgi:DNA replication regulator SLD3
VRLISRAVLPLSWLDRVSSVFYLSGPGLPLFSVSDPALETLLTTETKFPQVLVAREKASGSLCAVERARRGQFALCGIGSWVLEEDLVQISVSQQYAVPFVARLPDYCGDWRKYAALRDDGDASSERPAKRLKLTMQCPSSIVSKPIARQITTPKNMQIESQPPSRSNAPPSPTIEAPHPPAMTKEQLFETLVSQYLEALYLSRTSLAFFAKGPLSRTRIAFLAPTSTLSLSDLTNFLRNMILSYYGAIDKKFEEKLPSMVTELALQLSDSDNPKEKSRKRKAKKKRLKLGKEGIYPFEIDYIKNWWKGDEETLRADESAKQRLSRRIGDLRTRETLLQIILVLEVLALEASSDWKQTALESTTFEPNNDVGATQRLSKSKWNSKKQQDINTILDVLADKLMIWQDVDLDIGFSGAERSPVRGSTSGLKGDKLGGFCFEVLIPLYVLLTHCFHNLR